MARTPTGAALTRLHRRQQLALQAITVRDLFTLSKLWNSPYDVFAAATGTLVQSRRRDSAAAASRYYGAYRTAEGVGGDFSPVRAGTMNRDLLRASLYAEGLGSYSRALRAGRTATDARQVALVNLSGVVSMHVLNAGRETITASVGADKRARGYQRVTSAEPCAFCTMLSSRGPVYKEQTADFEAHKHCACSAEPVYPGGEWTDQNRQHAELWDRAQAEALESGEFQRGTSNDALNALRRQLAGV